MAGLKPVNVLKNQLFHECFSKILFTIKEHLRMAAFMFSRMSELSNCMIVLSFFQQRILYKVDLDTKFKFTRVIS